MWCFNVEVNSCGTTFCGYSFKQFSLRNGWCEASWHWISIQVETHRLSFWHGDSHKQCYKFSCPSLPSLQICMLRTCRNDKLNLCAFSLLSLFLWRLVELIKWWHYPKNHKISESVLLVMPIKFSILSKPFLVSYETIWCDESRNRASEKWQRLFLWCTRCLWTPKAESRSGF